MTALPLLFIIPARGGSKGIPGKNIKLWDVGSRIAHQMRVCSWRLRQVSEAYREQLCAKVDKETLSTGDRFEDGFTWLAYLSIQAFLVDACVLRDYLSEFYALHLCPDPAFLLSGPITSMGTLKKRVLDKIKSPDAETSMLKTATADGGWLHKLGSYRDLVVHCAPLAKAKGPLFAVLEELPFKDGALPAIRLPIPADPVAVSKSRASGVYFVNLEEQFELFLSANHGDAESSDGLTYCYDALGALAHLSRQLGNRSPIAPKIPHFDVTNIIDDIKITTL